MSDEFPTGANGEDGGSAVQICFWGVNGRDMIFHSDEWSGGTECGSVTAEADGIDEFDGYNEVGAANKADGVDETDEHNEADVAAEADKAGKSDENGEIGESDDVWESGKGVGC
ncbi:hypothetical protein BS47DRAFT_1366598 [Hydnum rufescens UP504]|uniref:Uncharacterized protein n=1 Tax=Hydnum rufescens UP504 TaxID=1448309 RepID=A0A9P6AL13_9AGAM|nr:hypothetical protein BS47DRAFT_1366598 [Hydnum rufescens UP504]